VIAAEEVEVSPNDSPETPRRRPSDVEDAMAANARSRDHQGKAEDKARREHHRSMTGDDEGDQPRGQPGRSPGRTGRGEAGKAVRGSVPPEARSISDARQDSSDEDRAADEGMGEPRTPPRGSSSRP